MGGSFTPRSTDENKLPGPNTKASEAQIGRLRKRANRAIGRGENEAAVRAMVELARLDPERFLGSHVFLSNRGESFAALQQWTEAMADHEAACALSPDDAMQWARLARVRREGGDMEGAAKAVDCGVAANERASFQTKDIYLEQAELAQLRGEEALVFEALARTKALRLSKIDVFSHCKAVYAAHDGSPRFEGLFSRPRK